MGAACTTILGEEAAAGVVGALVDAVGVGVVDRVGGCECACKCAAIAA